MARKERLSKIKMPKMSMAEQEAEMDMELLDQEMPEEEGLPPADENGLEPEMAMDAEEGELELFSDEELLDELKRRGLSAEAPEEEDEDEQGQEADDEDEDTEAVPPAHITGGF